MTIDTIDDDQIKCLPIDVVKCLDRRQILILESGSIGVAVANWVLRNLGKLYGA